jgi:hypothetical protein
MLKAVGKETNDVSPWTITHVNSAIAASQKIIPIICHCQCTERYAGRPALSFARSILMVNLFLCCPPLVLLMRNNLAGLNVTATATFYSFVIKICDVDQNEDLTNRVGHVYPCRTINSGCVLRIFDNRMM